MSPRAAEIVARLAKDAPAHPWWTDEETARYLGVPVGTLQSGRHYKNSWLAGCAVRLSARAVRYSREAVLEALARRLAGEEVAA